MGVKFQIEFIGNLKDGYLLAKKIDKEKDFFLTENSRLEDVLIRPETTIPRAHDKNGNQRHDLFVFWAQEKSKFQKFSNNQIITLHE